LDTGVRTDHQEFRATSASATIDITGVQTEHQGWESRVASGIDISSGWLQVCSGDPDCARDDHGHGTHVAGTAAGASYGVAPAAKIAAVKVLNSQGSGKASWCYAALDLAVGHHVHNNVVAVALLGVGASNREASFKDAVDMAVNAGVTVVVAAGNNNQDACNYAPAFVPSAITVGASTSEDERAGFSNWGEGKGSCVNIWAPGDDILSSGKDTDTSWSTLSGTSMAAAHVAGAAAIALGMQPSATPGEVFRKLKQVAERVRGQPLLRIGKPSAGGAPAAAPAQYPSDR